MRAASGRWKVTRESAAVAKSGVAKSKHGEVSEWSNVPDSKSGVALCVTVGSNPTLSAN